MVVLQAGIWSPLPARTHMRVKPRQRGPPLHVQTFTHKRLLREPTLGTLAGVRQRENRAVLQAHLGSKRVEVVLLHDAQPDLDHLHTLHPYLKIHKNFLHVKYKTLEFLPSARVQL